VIKPRPMALQTTLYLAKARRVRQLAIQQGYKLVLRGELPHAFVGPKIVHNPFKRRPRNVLQYLVQYAIVVTHGFDPRIKAMRLVHKFKPDTSGTSPGMTSFV